MVEVAICGGLCLGVATRLGAHEGFGEGDRDERSLSSESSLFTGSAEAFVEGPVDADLCLTTTGDGERAARAKAPAQGG